MRLSRSVHAEPSLLPWRVKSFGSRPGESFAEVSAYTVTIAGAGQLVGDPAGRGEGQPLRRRVAVGEVGGDLVGRVLGAGGHGGDLRQQAAGQAARGGAAQVALNRIAVAVEFNGGRRRLRIGGLERGREVAGCRRRSGNRRTGRDDRPDEDQRPESGDEATPAVVLASRGPRSRRALMTCCRETRMSKQPFRVTAVPMSPTCTAAEADPRLFALDPSRGTNPCQRCHATSFGRGQFRPGRLTPGATR